ncbi:MAG: hypothetical protein Wins2KO_00680 [Winogradskyella sp.]
MVYYIKEKIGLQLLVLLLVIFSGLLCFSCNEPPKPSSLTESNLIIKVNAVQEQIMAQGDITKEEEQALLSLCSIISHNDGLANYDSNERMVLKDVEFVTICEGCEALSKEETETCFNDKISTFIEQEFNISLSKDLNLKEQKTVDAFFIINETGNVTGLKVRNSEVTIQAEILRTLRRIPVMKPAIRNGQPVSVLCSIVLNYGNEIDVDVAYIPEIPEDLELNN